MSRSVKNKIISVTPFISLIIFLSIGFQTGEWHPTWVVFFLIPLVPFLLNMRRINLSFTFLVCIIYVAVGLITKIWHPTWIIFLSIPVFHIIFPGKKLVLWQSKEDKERNQKKQQQKSQFNDFRDDFVKKSNDFGNFFRDGKQKKDKRKDDTETVEPDVEVIFNNDKKK